jgi:hypothetical protein
MVTEKSGHALSEIAVRRQPAQLDINVIYTDCEATLAAIRYSARLATSLHAGIRIVLRAIAPWPLTLDECPMCEAHHRRLLSTVVDGFTSRRSRKLFAVASTPTSTARCRPTPSLLSEAPSLVVRMEC